ncbi:hypothetical protein Peur_049476 [Populus x canadensis]
MHMSLVLPAAWHIRNQNVSPLPSPKEHISILKVLAMEKPSLAPFPPVKQRQQVNFLDEKARTFKTIQVYLDFLLVPIIDEEALWPSTYF